MKNVLLVFPLLIAVIFSTLISTPIPIADETVLSTNDETVPFPIVESNSTSQQIEVTTTEDVVSYSTPTKVLQYHKGIFDDTTLTLSNDIVSFDISSFDWYVVQYYNSDILVADVTSNISYINQEIAVAAFLFPAETTDLSQLATFDIDTNATPTVQLVYTDANQSACHKIIASASQDTFEQVLSLSTYWQLSRENTDEVSQALIESFSYEDNYKLNMVDNFQTQSLTDQQVATMSTTGMEYANTAQTVACNAYDSYTDTDSYIHSYESTLKGKSQSYLVDSQHMPYTDDPIVNIIPRQLFTTAGTYSYIGKEYGFFIKTAVVSSETLSSYIVFDIDVVAPYPQRPDTYPSPSVTVTPLFFGTTKYANIITDQQYSNPNLALANINVGVSVENLTEKNIGDAGYIASQDYGYAIGSYAFDICGTGSNKNSDRIDIDNIQLFLGFIDITTTLASTTRTIMSVAKSIQGVLTFAMDCYNANQRVVSESLSKSNNTFTASGTLLGNTNTNSMISNYGNLVKGFTCTIPDATYADTDYPILYKTSDHYFKVEYGFCQKNSDVNWDAVVATGISVDIYQDKTNNFYSLLETGEFDYLDSVVGGRIDSYNEYPSTTSGGEIAEDQFYHTAFVRDTNAEDDAHEDEDYTPANGSYRDFTFTPNRTHTYCIETFNLSPGADSYLKIYDSQNNRITFDDDNGGSLRAKITVTLTAGQTYRIRTMCYNYTAGSYDFIVRKSGTLIQPTRSTITPTNVVLSNDSVWLIFVPTYDDFYTFTTTGSTDTYLTLYDNDYNRYTFNDDSGAGMNALIDMYLQGGKTYYLKVNANNMGSGSCNVYVSRQREFLFGTEGAKVCEYMTYWDSPQFYRLEVTYTAEYTFKTSTYDDGDTYMELYDSSWTLLASNDDIDGDTLNSQIKYTLQSGSVYYIKIYNLYRSDDFGILYYE